jgi:hypothetical protein
MKKVNVLSLLFLLGHVASAQSDYLITSKADTIWGEVRILSYDNIDRAQVVNKGKKEMFTALQLLSLNKNGEHYKPVKMENTIRLMKVIKSGYLTLYGFRLPNQTTYEGRFLLKQDGTSLEMPNLGFKKILSAYLQDCSEVSEKIKSGGLGREKIYEIIELYNACMLSNKPLAAKAPVAAEPKVSTQHLEAVQNLMNKIKDQDFASKEDALDILRDIESKVNRNEPVSNYLIDGLSNSLKDQSVLAEDVAKLIALLKK